MSTTEGPLTPEELADLRGITSPTIANAVERLRPGAPRGWYTNGAVRCLFPELGPVVGYAVTLAVRSAAPSEAPPFSSRKPYWDHILAYPAPRIVVAQDLDQPPGGAYWGEVNASIHRALGCVGVITDGAVRDLDEVRRLGFAMHAAEVQVSHGHSHLADFGRPVTVFGMAVRPGDLLHADRHGAVVIPAEVARRVAAAAKEVEAYERPMLELCRSPAFSTAGLAELLRNETV